MESYEILWKSIQPELERSMTSLSYATFVEPMKAVDIEGRKLILTLYGQDLIDGFFRGNLPNIVRTVLARNSDTLDDIIIYNAKDKEDYLAQFAKEEVATVENVGTPINKKFTFESFVVGSSNELSVAAAKAVAENPGEAYNPLFIYGGSGLGKTHLLMAIANYIKLHYPRLNVLYATCEQFTNQMVESIAKGKGMGSVEFRNKWRNVDVLLIDDVQFLANKQGTQTEFFHTFNELVLQNKQVVLTSDRPPQEIDVLEERLKTRFEGGLLTDITKPELEMRIAILRKKAEEQKCIIDIDVLMYIAETYDVDNRSLIGKLTKIIFASKLHERTITVELVKEALKESAGEKQEELKVEDIINCVCNFYKVNKSDVLGKKKNKEFVEPRQICIYLITDMMNVPLVTVGKMMGGRDHATIIYARDKISEQMKTDSRLFTEITDIKKMLLKE